LIPLEEVAGFERGIPSEWIVPAGNNVTSEFEAFVRPLIGELPQGPTQLSSVSTDKSRAEPDTAS
jgi:hypothetical protein